MMIFDIHELLSFCGDKNANKKRTEVCSHQMYSDIAAFFSFS
jgi:hypothetical protein